MARLIENGQVSDQAPESFSAVILNFLANGGDGYPIKANGDNFRFLLDDGSLSAAIDESSNFTEAGVVPANALGEQQALKTFLQSVHGTPDQAYTQADTAAGLDGRIQNLGLRSDSVLAGDQISGSLGRGGNRDALVGTAGDDVIRGGAGNDTIDGREGDDLIDGGIGRDRLTGGGGRDRFLLSGKGGGDTITDFTVGKDLLLLDGGLSFASLSLVGTATGTEVRQRGRLLALLEGVQPGDGLDAESFLSV
ncbi:hypothetical protein KBY90_10990 [Cyanobium sp. CH-040]|nr:hypothetical protein [Cyanobium sp. CH-040]